MPAQKHATIPGAVMAAWLGTACGGQTITDHESTGGAGPPPVSTGGASASGSGGAFAGGLGGSSGDSGVSGGSCTQNSATFAHVAAGATHTCAIAVGGSLWCWGANDHGQLGAGPPSGSPCPLPVDGFLGSAATVAAGDAVTCVVKLDGTLWCWGDVYNSDVDVAAPEQVLLPDKVTQLVVRRQGFCALTPDHNLWCSYIGYVVSQFPEKSDVQVPSLGGGGHTCMILTDNSLWCLGANECGQLGTGDFVSAYGFPITAIGSGLRSVGVGATHTCAAKTDGTFWCWGCSDSGAVGIGPATKPEPLPVLVETLTDVQVVSAGAGCHKSCNDYTCALKTDGTLWCWGNNAAGQLGIGSNQDASTPTPVVVLGSDVKGFATGSNHACALTKHGSIWCWGANGSGQLGIGSTSNSTVPSLVAGF